MSITGWIIFGTCSVGLLGMWYTTSDRRIKDLIIAIAIIGILFGGMWFYFHNTASGRRELVDSKSELQNGLEREINVYTADGELIAHYEGKIDLEDNEGGYVIFDFEGKRYTYYNCFVESIAKIK